MKTGSVLALLQLGMIRLVKDLWFLPAILEDSWLIYKIENSTPEFSWQVSSATDYTLSGIPSHVQAHQKC